MATKSLTFELYGKDRTASKAIRGVSGEVDSAGQQFKNFGKVAALAAAGVGIAFVKFAADGVKALARIETINAQTVAAIESTGGAANVSAKHVESLAKTLEGMTATEAETIQEGANMLLTFKNIRNEVGEGNDVFDQATAALVDMSRAGMGDVSSVAIQLGKALNDPIGGISALTRVGVQFTEDQKSVIRSLVETGDVAGAQKIILQELNDQFGGSGAAYAETYAGKLDLLNDKFGDLKEAVAAPLMDPLVDVMDTLSESGAIEDTASAITDVVNALTDLEDKTGVFSDFIDDMIGAGDKPGPGEFIQQITDLVSAPLKVYDDIANGKGPHPSGILEALLPSSEEWGQYWRDNTTITVDGVNNVRGGMGGGLTAMNGDMTVFRDGIGFQWSEMWAGLSATLGTGWEIIGGQWSQMWAGLGATLETSRQVIGAGVAATVEGMRSQFSSGWEHIRGVFSTSAASIQAIANGVASTFAGVAQTIRNAFDGIGKFISDAFGPIGDFLGGAGNAIRNFFGGTGDAARNIKGRLKEAAYRSPGSGGSALARVRSTLPRGLMITDTLSNPGRDAMLGLQRSASSYHYDSNNPAVDIAGPIPLLHQYARQLQAMGGWRQFLWQTAGHYDHIHVAHGGGMVSSSWPRMPGDRVDERTARLQVGEKVVPRDGEYPNVTNNNYTFEMHPILDNDPQTTATIAGREFARAVAGGR